MKGIARIDLVSAASLTQAIAQFFRWWRDELVALLPEKLRQQLQYGEHKLVVSFPDNGVEVADCQHDQVESRLRVFPDTEGTLKQDDSAKLARMRKRWGANVAVMLPSDHVLSLSFPLPLEAEKNLHEVVGYELGRHIPFKIEQIYFDYVVSERRKNEKKVWLSMMVVPKKQVDPLLEKVRSWGFIPDALTVRLEGNVKRENCKLAEFNLLPRAQQVGARGSMNTLSKLMAISAVLLAMVVAGYPLMMQEMRIRDLRSQEEAVKRDAAGVLSMKQQLEKAAEESTFVEEKKQKYPEVLDVLNALTTLLPDDTWLEQFELKDNRIRLLGLSADASSLIERLENSPLLQKVAFDSPIVKDSRLGRFRFQIVAELTAKEGE